MGMPLELKTMIETNGEEKRLDGNTFTLEKEGYQLYPLNIPILVYEKIDDDPIGKGTITKLTFENGKTMIIYQLLKLKSTN